MRQVARNDLAAFTYWGLQFISVTGDFLAVVFLLLEAALFLLMVGWPFLFPEYIESSGDLEQPHPEGGDLLTIADVLGMKKNWVSIDA